MLEVTQKRFYQYVNPRDIIIKSEFQHDSYGFCCSAKTSFKTRNGLTVGECHKNYNTNEIPNRYFLTENALKEETL